MTSDTWLSCAHAVVDGALWDDVLVGVRGTRIATVDLSGRPPPPDAVRLDGVTLPGLVNAHSHAFHRALRGRTHRARGSFWSWRQQMWALADALDPDRYHALARAVFGEMALAGITCVGEFHYLHHPAGGGRYTDPNAMGAAVMSAAADAGIRLTLLDTAYLTGQLGATTDAPSLAPVQQRFSDGSVDAWAARVAALTPTAGCRIGAAAHSVRAVPPPDLARIAAVVGGGDLPGDAPVLHAHVAEQLREAEDAGAHHGRTPTQLFADAGAVTPSFTAVHGVWLDDDDIALLAGARATVCACPTTERDLADGVVDAAALVAAGAGLALGTDQHAEIDLLAEARAVELDQRLTSGVRGQLPADVLLAAATTGGAHSLGWPEAGRLAEGALADLCVVGLDSVRMAGLRREDLLDGIVFAGTAADVTDTMVGGRWVVRDGAHTTMDVATELTTAIGAVDAVVAEETPP